MTDDELLDELGRIEAKIDQLWDFFYGGPDDRVPMDVRLVELERFQRKTEFVLYGEDPADDKGLVNKVKNRRIVAIAFVVGTLFSIATAVDMIFGNALRKHFTEVGQKAPLVMAPVQDGTP